MLIKYNRLMKKTLLIVLLFIVSVVPTMAEEITLFNSKGEAIAYIDTDDEDIPMYLWNGTPVAYLVPDRDAFSIYGFNGKHLGWFEDGLIYDHEGYVVGFQKGAISEYTQYEPSKSYKQYKPYKGYKEYAPYKPYLQNSFSSQSLSLFLLRGSKN